MLSNKIKSILNLYSRLTINRYNDLLKQKMDLEDQLDEKNKQIKEWEKKYNDLERQFKEYQNKSQDELKKASALQKELVYHEEFFIIF